MPTAHIEQAVQQLLRDNASVVALVSTRIHVGHRPQGDALPSIVVRKMSGGDDHDLDHGESHREPTVAVECYAAYYYKAAELA
jgi:hypothetical protein